MHRTSTSIRAIGLITSAMAGALLAGCATTAGSHAAFAGGQPAIPQASGKARQAIANAEAAVQAQPRDAGARALLANAYLDAGRFASAETTYGDALSLGDTSPRTALSLALALMGEGKLQQASALLEQWQDRIAPADLGLALALAGQPERGVAIMSSAIRGGENDVKIRQNLAYAYALAGRWREARLMAAQDLAGDQVGDRMEQWAQMVQPDAWQTRIAALLQVPAGVADGGQPVRLALADNHGAQQLAAQSAKPVAPPASVELPALATAEPAPAAPAPQPAAVTTIQQAMAAAPVPAAAQAMASVPAPVASHASGFAHAFARPAMSVAPARAVAQDAAAFSAPLSHERVQRPAASGFAHLTPAVEMTESTHLVQLGSFATEQGAKRAWDIYTRKYPALAGHQMVISEAVVRGKHYWRVSAGGYGRSGASSTCGMVHGNGGGCIAWAKSRPLPGAVDTGIRLASR